MKLYFCSGQLANLNLRIHSGHSKATFCFPVCSSSQIFGTHCTLWQQMNTEISLKYHWFLSILFLLLTNILKIKTYTTADCATDLPYLRLTLNFSFSFNNLMNQLNIWRMLKNMSCTLKLSKWKMQIFHFY